MRLLPVATQRLLLCLVVTVGAFGLAPTAAMGAAGADTVGSYDYDWSAVARVDVREASGAQPSTPQLTGAQEWSASPPIRAQGTSTTRFTPVVATNSGGPVGRQTTILGENMTDRVMPFAERTNARTLGFGSSADEWAQMTPQQRYELNDGQLRARINEGDDFRYIGQDPARPPDVRARFDLTRSEILRLQERGIPYETVSPEEVAKILGQAP